MNTTWTKPLSSKNTEFKAIDLINSAHHLALVLSSPRPGDKTLDSPQDLFDLLQEPMLPLIPVLDLILLVGIPSTSSVIQLQLLVS
jgi:hypothetical protein